MEEEEEVEEEEGRRKIARDSNVFKLVWDRDRERKRRVTGNNYPPSFFSPSVRNDSWSKERGRGEGHIN